MRQARVRVRRAAPVSGGLKGRLCLKGQKAVGDFAGGGLAHVPSTARGGRSGRPAGTGLTCAAPWEQRVSQVQPGAELPGAPSLRRCGGRARATAGVLPGVCTLTMRRCRPQHLDGEADRGRGRASRIPGARALDPPGYRVRVGERLRYAVAVAGRDWILHLAYVSRNWPVRRFAARSQSASKLSSPSARKRTKGKGQSESLCVDWVG